MTNEFQNNFLEKIIKNTDGFLIKTSLSRKEALFILGCCLEIHTSAFEHCVTAKQLARKEIFALASPEVQQYLNALDEIFYNIFSLSVIIGENITRGKNGASNSFADLVNSCKGIEYLAKDYEIDLNEFSDPSNSYNPAELIVTFCINLQNSFSKKQNTLHQNDKKFLLDLSEILEKYNTMFQKTTQDKCKKFYDMIAKFTL